MDESNGKTKEAYLGCLTLNIDSQFISILKGYSNGFSTPYIRHTAEDDQFGGIEGLPSVGIRMSHSSCQDLRGSSDRF